MSESMNNIYPLIKTCLDVSTLVVFIVGVIYLYIKIKKISKYILYVAIMAWPLFYSIVNGIIKWGVLHYSDNIASGYNIYGLMLSATSFVNFVVMIIFIFLIHKASRRPEGE